MKSTKLLLSAAVLALTLSGPVWADSFSITIGTPPPEVREEVIPAPPGPTDLFAWHAGHWRWIDERHVWIPGNWVKRPSPKAEWVQPRWEHHQDADHHDHYEFHEGHWNQ